MHLDKKKNKYTSTACKILIHLHLYLDMLACLKPCKKHFNDVKSYRTPPGVLCSALGALAHEGYGSIGISAEEGYRDDQEDGASLL